MFKAFKTCPRFYQQWLQSPSAIHSNLFESCGVLIAVTHTWLIWKDHMMTSSEKNHKDKGPKNNSSSPLIQHTKFFWCINFLKYLITLTVNNRPSSYSKNHTHHWWAPFGNLFWVLKSWHKTTQKLHTLSWKTCH